MTIDWHAEPLEVGPCRILSRLGEGGMGTVYKAHHCDLDLDVAVKVLHPHLAERSGMAERFLREARLAARLNHSAIVRVFDCGVDRRHHFIVMELADGRSLRELIETQGSIPVGRSLEIAEEIASALGEALRQVGLLHRDIKPDNILLTSGGAAKVADLGLAKAIAHRDTHAHSDGTTPGIALGTPRYMSPEQSTDARTVDHRADIFSLGATLYHMLSGNAPFDGDSVFSILKQVAEAEPAPLPAHVPSGVEELVMWMLAKEADDRFQTYRDLIDALKVARESTDDTETLDARREPAGGRPMIPSLRTHGRVLRPAAPPENRALLVVDIQNDFCPGGALAVPEGDRIVPVINELARRFRHVILTQDWHCADHLSFASSHPGKKVLERIELSYGPQVLWPDHCVQGAAGAEFHADLRVPHSELVIRKGYNREIDSYSAFFENDRKTPTGLAGYLRERGFTRLFIVGLATDFCVAYSALDARKLGFEVTVIESGCRGIDVDGSLDAAWDQMSQAGVIRT